MALGHHGVVVGLRRLLVAGALGELLEVHARAEGAVAGARQHHRADRVVGFELRERVGQRGQQLLVERVAPLGPVERQHLDRAAPLTFENAHTASTVSRSATLSLVPRHSGTSSPTLATAILSSCSTIQCAWFSSCMVKHACSEL